MSGAGQLNGGVFAAMKFAPYKFEEYPKHITTADGVITVKSLKEELDAMVEKPVVPAEHEKAMAEIAQAYHTAKAERDELRDELRHMKARLDDMQAQKIHPEPLNLPTLLAQDKRLVKDTSADIPKAKGA